MARKKAATIETIPMTCPCGETHSNDQLEAAGGCPNGGEPFVAPPFNESPKDRKARWNAEASKALVGKRIVAVRWLTDQEVKTLGWYQSAICLHLDDGTVIFPSQDDEGNGAGALFGQGPNGEDQTWPTGV